MPTFGYSDTSEKFQDNLDLLEVIIQKYCESHQIILVGQIRLEKMIRINVFVTLFRETLRPPPTYQHGFGSSQIDYIFARSENLVTNLIISDRDKCNTSSHVPVNQYQIAESQISEYHIAESILPNPILPTFVKNDKVS